MDIGLGVLSAIPRSGKDFAFGNTLVGSGR